MYVVCLTERIISLILRNMTLLIILKVNFPYPLKTGGQQAVYHMIDRLRDKINIILIYDKHIVDDEAEKILKEKWSNVKFYPFQKTYLKQVNGDLFYFFWIMYKVFTKAFSWHKLVNKNTILNSVDEHIYSAAFLNFIADVIKKEKVDIVQTEFYNSLNLGYFLPKNIKKIYVQHEIRYVRNYLFISALENADNLDLYKTNKLKHEEIMAMNQYNIIVTLTAVDRLKLLKDGVTTNIMSSFACIPPNKIISEYTPANNKLSFLGSSRHSANVRGLLWFLDKVWPMVIKQNSKIELTIIGEWSTKKIAEVQKRYPNIKFTGIVDDLSEVLPGTIMVVPITEGSGMRMKILDAINNGCAFVTTFVGVEGLDFEDGQDCFIADDAGLFAQKVLTLNSDVDLQKRLFYQAQKTYNEKYSADVAVARRLEIYKSLINE